MVVKMSSMRQIPLTCSGHTRPVVDLDFSSITNNGFFLISACKDGKPMLRQGDTGDWIGTFEGHKGAVWSATLNCDASQAATGAADFSAKIWDAINGDEMFTFQHKHIVKCVRFSHDAKRLLTGSNEKILRIFDIDQPNADARVFRGHTGNLNKVIWLADDKRIVSASDDKTLRIWDVTSQLEVLKIELPAAPADLELSQDGKIITVSCGNNVYFYSADRFEKMKEYATPSKVNSASLLQSQNIFVCGGDDFKMYKMDFSDGSEIESFKGHFGPVHCVRFSPDSELYASGSEDGTLRLWQTIVGKTYGLWKCINPEDTAVATHTVVKSEL